MEERFNRREDFRKRGEDGEWNEDNSDVRLCNAAIQEKSLHRGGIFGIPSLSRAKKPLLDHSICAIDDGSKKGAKVCHVAEVRGGRVINLLQVYEKFKTYKPPKADCSHTGENRASGQTNDPLLYSAFANGWTERNSETIKPELYLSQKVPVCLEQEKGPPTWICPDCKYYLVDARCSD